MKMLPQLPLSLNPPPAFWSDMLWRCPPSAQQSQLEQLKTQLPQQLATDPRAWGRDDVRTFLRYCVQEFDLPKLDLDQFAINGKGLCMLTSKDFNTRIPGAGDVVYNMLQVLLYESQPPNCILPQSPVTPTSRYAFPPHSHPATPTWPSMVPPDSPFLQGTLPAIPHKFFPPTNSITLSPPPSSIDSATSSPPQGQQQYTSQVMNVIAAAAATTTTAVATSAAAAAAAAASLGLTTTTTSSANSNNKITNNGNIISSNGSSNSNSNHGNSNCNNHSKTTLPEISLPNNNGGGGGGNAFNMPNSKSNGDNGNSNLSDSDDECGDSKANIVHLPLYGSGSPPITPLLADFKHNWQLSNSIMRSGGSNSSNGGNCNSSNNSSAVTTSGSNGNGGGSLSAPTTPSYTYKVKREFFPESAEPNTNGRLLWDFLQQLLNERHQKFKDLIAWKCSETGVFKIVDPAGLAKLWGIQKNHPSMNYDKMSRALRYYYRVNILRKVQGERHCYQFLRNPAELKGIKNISQLRQNPTSQPNGASNSNGNCNASPAERQDKSTSSGIGGAAAVNALSNDWSMPTTNQQQQQQQQQTLEHQQFQQQQQQYHHHQQQQQQQQQHHQQEHPLAREHRAHPLTLPVMAAAVAAVGGYVQPPPSPLFYHALNYFSANGVTGPPPNSPASLGLPTTPRDKFEFHPLKAALSTTTNSTHDAIMNNGNSSNSNNSNNNDNDKPTDLSVNGSNSNNIEIKKERERQIQNQTMSTTEKTTIATGAASDDCYPLMRSADGGLTTIKLIRRSCNSEEPMDATDVGQEQKPTLTLTSIATATAKVELMITDATE